MTHWKNAFVPLFLSTLLSGSALAAPPPSATPAISSAEPIYTIGGPNDSLSHARVALSELQYGLYVSLTPAVVSVRAGEPVNVSLWVANGTNSRMNICVEFLGLTLHFNVVDSSGALLPMRTPADSQVFPLPPHRCALFPARQWRYIVPLSDFAPVTKPGRYTATALLQVHFPNATVHEIRSNPVTINVTP